MQCCGSDTSACLQANDYAGHNSSLFVLGVMILWFGWYGFNPGSQLVLVGLQNSFAVSNCAVTTTLAPAAAGLSSLLVKAIMSHMTTGVLPQTVAWWILRRVAPAQ